ncbi:MAG TPA: hypothetical protein VFA56_02660 [Gaiellaceae bacterium]|nr:hypothetical protein [Gaiellaceae bacterium]
MKQDSRKLRNELIFRDANERIRRAQSELELPDDPMPFICECSDERCRQIVQLTQAEYEDVRAGDRTFFIAPGHDASDGEVVARGDRHWVLQKAVVRARRTDPRSR